MLESVSKLWRMILLVLILCISVQPFDALAAPYPDQFIKNIDTSDGPMGLEVSWDGKAVYVACYWDNTVDLIWVEMEVVLIIWDLISPDTPIYPRPEDVAVMPEHSPDKVYASFSNTRWDTEALAELKLESGNTIVEAFMTGDYNLKRTNQLAACNFIGGEDSEPLIFGTDTMNDKVLEFTTDGNLKTVFDTGDGPTGVACCERLSTSRAYLFTANALDDTVTLIDWSPTDLNFGALPVGDSPQNIAMDHLCNKTYVSNRWDGTISVIDNESRQVVNSVDLGEVDLRGLTVTPDDDYLMVTAGGSEGKVIVLALEDLRIVKVIPVGSRPVDIVVTPDGERAYVSNYDDDNVTLLMKEQEKVRLIAGVQGEGSGLFTAEGYTSCKTWCAAAVPKGELVTMTFTPDPGSVFLGWSGDGCPGVGECKRAFYDEEAEIYAHVGLADASYHTLNLSKQGEGQGKIVSEPVGVDCGEDCDQLFVENSKVVLTPIPEAGSAFDGWSEGAGEAGLTGRGWSVSDCPGNGGCEVSMDQDHAIIATFNPDADGDGISDSVENTGPNDGDANNDGVKDFEQSNVASFKDVHGAWGTLVTDENTHLQNAATSTGHGAENSPSSFDFPSGFFSFSIAGLDEGASVKATLTLDSPDDELTTYYKYGATPDNDQDHWYEFMYNGSTGAEMEAVDGKNTIVLNLIDGARGDDDLEANGVIKDIGGPGAAASGGSSGLIGGGSSGSSGYSGCFVDSIMK